MNESKVMQFIEKFDELYAKNKGVIFQSFQEGGFTLSEQKEIFDGLKTKQKCQLYNTISVDSRKNFYNSLSADDAKNFKASIRKQAVADAKILERDLLKKQHPISMNFESSVWEIFGILLVIMLPICYNIIK